MHDLQNSKVLAYEIATRIQIKNAIEPTYPDHPLKMVLSASGDIKT